MGQKAYLFSRNLKVPEKIVNHNLKDFYNLEKKIYDKYKLDNLKPEYVSNFTSELMGELVLYPSLKLLLQISKHIPSFYTSL